jgi:hypothetical protein
MGNAPPVTGFDRPEMPRRRKRMPEWVLMLGVFAAYIILMRWVLPRMGVST